jgi:hypothetical protein
VQAVEVVVGTITAVLVKMVILGYVYDGIA